MATLARRLAANVPGALFVDSSCIDCGACRWIAPASFDLVGSQSRVHAQPRDASERARAAEALLSCPTASIGVARAKGAADATGTAAAAADAPPLQRELIAAAARFPRPFAPRALHCGFHREASFGAASWLLLRPAGNVLIDVPRFTAPLVRRLEQLGGVRWLFLTHRDDVDGHAQFAAHFGCERLLHRGDHDGATAGVERLLDGAAPIALADDLVALPTPGHTRGSACLLARTPAGADPAVAPPLLFSGDHLAWDDATDRPYGFRDACWHSWPQLIESTRRLVAYPFEWLLPGHGAPGRAPAEEMATRLRAAIATMEQQR